MLLHLNFPNYGVSRNALEASNKWRKDRKRMDRQTDDRQSDPWYDGATTDGAPELIRTNILKKHTNVQQQVTMHL